jgi:transposase InsO family protein
VTGQADRRKFSTLLFIKIIQFFISDRYAAIEFRRFLYIYGFRQSMPAKGICCENEQAESFFSGCKAELIEEKPNLLKTGLLLRSKNLERKIFAMLTCTANASEDIRF